MVQFAEDSAGQTKFQVYGYLIMVSRVAVPAAVGIVTDIDLVWDRKNIAQRRTRIECAQEVLMVALQLSAKATAACGPGRELQPREMAIKTLFDFPSGF